MKSKRLHCGCELISKLYFYVSNHRGCYWITSPHQVVNWFQNCIFTWAITGKNSFWSNPKWLWIDFKIVFLREQSQGDSWKSDRWSCCELISKLYFYVSNHRHILELSGRLIVVNWFQNCIFTWAITGYTTTYSLLQQLWIDFKIVFLREQSQGYWNVIVMAFSCELISKLYFYVSNHRWYWHIDTDILVVNWFQNCIFTWAITG